LDKVAAALILLFNAATRAFTLVGVYHRAGRRPDPLNGLWGWWPAEASALRTRPSETLKRVGLELAARLGR